MSIPEPRENPDLVGHDAAEAALREAVLAGRLHHAWLLTGAPGIGKATLAFRFARFLLAGLRMPAPGEAVFRRVAAGSHADLRTVRRTWDEKRKRMRGEIVVEDVVATTDFLRLTPAEGGWRVVIVDGAEWLNRNAANALLKILEEPPPLAVLLLVCAAPGRLLPTLRSRCRRLTLDPLGAADMAVLLVRFLPALPDEERRRLAALSEGSPGRALMLAEEDGLKVAGMVDEVLHGAPDFPLLKAYEIADTIGRSEGGFATFMELLRQGIARAVRDTLHGAGDAAQQRLVAARPLDAWGDVWHGLTRLQDETERLHLDRRQAIISGIAMLNGS